MKKFVFLLLFGCLFFLTSCIDLIEEMHLNRDGSGKYTLTFDMSKMFTDPMMKGMMEEMMKEQSGMAQEDGESMEMDTVIYFKDAPESETEDMDEKFWQTAVIRTTMSESKQKMIMSMEFEFDKLADIATFYQKLAEKGSDEGSDFTGGMMGPDGFLSEGAALFQLKGKKLTRLPADAPEKTEEGEGNEEMEFMKVFLASGTYKSIYHLPGKVKKSSIPGAEIEGKTVTVNHSLGEMMEGKAEIDGYIKFK